MSMEFSAQRLFDAYSELYACSVAAGKREELPSALSEKQVELFLGYLEILDRWNKVVNLVGDAAADELVERHLVDSIAAWLRLRSFFELPVGLPYLDVGSGAGIPGLIFKILEPERPIFLVEPRYKRVAFLKQVIAELALTDASALCSRMEELDLPRQSLALAFSRGVGRTEEFLASCRLLIAPGGALVEIVGPTWKPSAEAQEAQLSLVRTELDYLPKRSGCRLAVWTASA